MNKNQDHGLMPSGCLPQTFDNRLKREQFNCPARP